MIESTDSARRKRSLLSVSSYEIRLKTVCFSFKKRRQVSVHPLKCSGYEILRCVVRLGGGRAWRRWFEASEAQRKAVEDGTLASCVLPNLCSRRCADSSSE